MSQIPQALIDQLHLASWLSVTSSPRHPFDNLAKNIYDSVSGHVIVNGLTTY